MTDAPLTSTANIPPVDPVDPSVGVDPAAGEQNPLDALEAILQQAKAKANPAGDATAAGMPDPAAIAAAEEAKKQAELERMQAENRIKDEAKLKAELALLKNVSNSSEDQARVAQNEARQQDQDERAEKKAEYTIHQLGHTKI